jgi:transcriptional regulator with XRE-family HTH domain
MGKNTNYLAAAKESQKITINYWQECLDEDGHTRYWLANKSGVSQSMLSDYWSGKVDMSLINYYRICGALELRPYLIPKELDDNDITNVGFN